MYINENGQKMFYAYSFEPAGMPGFSEYQAVYSHFRIVKAKMYLTTQYRDYDGQGLTNYIVVGSRPFAATAAPLEKYPVSETYFVPVQAEESLRQAKYQRFHYPNSTTQCVAASFYPYTMVANPGPTQYQGESFRGLLS